MKRFLATLMLVAFVVTSFAIMPVSAAKFSDVTEGGNTEEAVTVLNKLGVINGYEDGTFRPNNTVTYEEAIKMIVCALGMGI